MPDVLPALGMPPTFGVIAVPLPSLAHTLSRYHRIRRLIDAERRKERQCSMRLLRLQALLLKAQERIASICNPPGAPLLTVSFKVTVSFKASPRRLAGANW